MKPKLNWNAEYNSCIQVFNESVNIGSDYLQSNLLF